MRCSLCGAELILVSVSPDQTIAANGFEHHTFMCAECRYTERCLVFMKNGREAEIGPDDHTLRLPTHAAPPTAPVAAGEGIMVPAGLLSRVLERIRGH